MTSPTWQELLRRRESRRRSESKHCFSRWMWVSDSFSKHRILRFGAKCRFSNARPCCHPPLRKGTRLRLGYLRSAPVLFELFCCRGCSFLTLPSYELRVCIPVYPIKKRSWKREMTEADALLHWERPFFFCETSVVSGHAVMQCLFCGICLCRDTNMVTLVNIHHSPVASLDRPSADELCR